MWYNVKKCLKENEIQGKSIKARPNRTSITDIDICVVQYGNHCPHVAKELLKCGNMTEEISFEFYVL